MSVRRRVVRWWSGASLRRKVLAVAVLALALPLPAVAVAVALEVRLADERSTVGSTQELLDDLQDLQGTSSEATDAMLYYSITSFQDDEFLEQFRLAAADIPEQVAALEREIPADLEGPMRELSSALDLQVSSLEEVAAFGDVLADDALEPEESLIDLFLASTQAVASAREAIASMEVRVDDRLAAQQQNAADLDAHASRAVVASWIVVFVVVVGGMALVTTSIVRRAERLTENGRRFLEGKPLLTLASSGDEIGQLAGGMFSIGGLLDQRRADAVAAIKARDDFLARISNELRPPLTAIISRGEALHDRDLHPDAREAARHVVKGGQHLLTLIDDLLDISKIETGDLSIFVEPVALHVVVEEAVALVSSRAASRSITVATDCAHDLMVAADRHRLTQVLLNLLSNAVKYNRPAGHVGVVAAVRDGMVRVNVTDTGFGIPPDGLRRLFRPFERLDAAKTGVEGSGIGLALTKHLVDAMDGAIGVDSVTGQGTTFWVDLPVSQGATSPRKVPSAGQTSVRRDDLAAGQQDGRQVNEQSSQGGGAPGHGDVPDDGAGAGEQQRRSIRALPRRVRLWWQDLPVRRKVLVAASGALLVSIPAAVLYVALEVRLADMRTASRETQEWLDDLNVVRDQSADATTAVSFYIIDLFAGEEAEALEDQVENLEAAIATGRERAAQLEQDLPPDLEGLFDEVSSSLEVQFAEYSTLAALEEVGDSPEDEDTVTSFMSGAVAGTEVRENVRTLRSELDAQLVAERREVSDLEALVSRAVLLSWVVTFAAVVGGAAVVTSDIVRRLERLSENGRRFITGEPLLPMGQSRDEIGQLVGGMISVAALLDTRRKEALAAARVRDEFLSRISHELRTPLTAIIGFGEILEDEDLDAEGRAAATYIHESGRRVLTLSDDLLDLSKAETGHLPISVELVSLQDAVGESIALVQSDAAGRSITIDVDTPDDLRVAADPERLQQVLVNLLSNAVKYNRPSGRVEVTATADNGTIQIRVSDTGPGISPEHQECLFSPFQRLDAARTGVEGNGIGLALTKHLVSAMGGTIGVDSDVGRGSTFWFDLPSAEFLVSPARSEEVAVPEGGPGSGTTDRGDGGLGDDDDRPLVAYIDADPIDVKRVEGIFRGRTERLQVLPEGRGAVGLVRLLRPQLVLLADELPDTDGEAVLRELKAAPDTAGTPVVILAADATTHHADLMVTRGAAAVLSRPVNTARLVEVLDADLEPV